MSSPNRAKSRGRIGTSDPYREFRQAVDRPEELIDLGRAALTIALPDYPDLDIPACLAQIDELAVAVTERCGGVADVYRSLAALNYSVVYGAEVSR